MARNTIIITKILKRKVSVTFYKLSSASVSELMHNNYYIPQCGRPIYLEKSHSPTTGKKKHFAAVFASDCTD